MVLQRTWKFLNDTGSSSASSTEANRSPSVASSDSDDSNCSNETVHSMSTTMTSPLPFRIEPREDSMKFVTTPQMAEGFLQRLRHRLGGNSLIGNHSSEAAMHSLELLRISVQSVFDKEVEVVIRSFIENYFQPAFSNIKENLGDSIFIEEALQKMSCALLENAKAQYNNGYYFKQFSTYSNASMIDGFNRTMDQSMPMQMDHLARSVPNTENQMRFPAQCNQRIAADRFVRAPAKRSAGKPTNIQELSKKLLAGSLGPRQPLASTNASISMSSSINTINNINSNMNISSNFNLNSTLSSSSIANFQSQSAPQPQQQQQQQQNLTNITSSNYIAPTQSITTTTTPTFSAVNSTLTTPQSGRRQIYWNTADISIATKFVLDVQANQAFGFGTDGKERLASKHPELIRYLPDSEDRDYLIAENIISYQNRNSRFLFLIYDEILKLYQTSDKYRNKPGVDMSMLHTFTVPEFMIEKMKVFFVDLNIKSRGLITNSFTVGNQAISNSHLRNALLQGAPVSGTDPAMVNQNVTTSCDNGSAVSSMTSRPSSLSSSHATLTALLNNSNGNNCNPSTASVGGAGEKSLTMKLRK